jgi:hypothetical protein
VSVVDVVLFVILALFGFSTLAVVLMKPDKVRIYLESRLAKFGVEISRSNKTSKPHEEIEPSRDG